MAYVPYKNTFALIGGQSVPSGNVSRAIYIFESNKTHWSWEELEEGLSEPKVYLVAIPVDESIFPGCD